MSKIPSLEEVLKLYTKKDLWNRIQEKNKQIAELQKQLEASETQNKRVLEKLELITKSNQELEKQLEEKEKELREIRVENYTIKSYRDFLNNKCKNLIKENKKLKQQLKSQPAEIVEKIKGIAIIDVEEYSNDPILYKITEEELDTILKEYQK